MFLVLSEDLEQGDQRAEPESFRVVTKSPQRVTTALGPHPQCLAGYRACGAAFCVSRRRVPVPLPRRTYGRGAAYDGIVSIFFSDKRLWASVDAYRLREALCKFPTSLGAERKTEGLPW